MRREPFYKTTPRIRRIDEVMFGPTVVCLCGSTRFKDEYIRQNYLETMKGHIVLTVGWFGHVDGMPSDEQKEMLDDLHLCKINLASEVVVICPGGYIGDSTRSEIAWARKTEKPIRYPYGEPKEEE